MNIRAIIAAMVVCPASVANAQLRPASENAIVFQTRPHLAPRTMRFEQPKVDDSGSFMLEALAGTVGSLAGIGIVGLTSKCDVEDLGCTILTVGAGGALGIVGATAGTSLMARRTGARRSLVGAALGATVGTGIGLGIHYLLNQSSDRNLGDQIVIPIFVLSQGTVSALGSRLVGRARRPR